MSTDSGDVGAAQTAAKLLLELQGRAKIDVKGAGRTLQVRPAGTPGIAVHIHPGGLDLALDQERAASVLESIPGAYLKDPEDPISLVTVDGELLEPYYDEVLEAAAQAVELSAAPRPAKTARRAAAPKAAATPRVKAVKAVKAAKVVPPPPPRCPVCKQYELLANGECPSGYC